MSTATLAYPPPLSAPPTVETLERLLAGLQVPVQRGVPTPPRAPTVPERLFGDAPPRRGPDPVVVDLTWSAGKVHAPLPFPFGFFTPFTGAATVAVAAALTLLASRGDIGLP